MQKFELMATCASGIEALVGKELRELGYDVEVQNGRVRFEGTIEDILRTNLWLRTADRIKIVVSEFEAKTFDSLFEQTKQINWDKLLPIDANFPVEGRSRNSQLHSVPDAQAIVKKAIVNQLSETYHRRTRLPETGAVYPIEVAINKDQVQLTLDTTGDSLFKRGYRIDKGGAPLKENMAAALVLLTSWKPDMPFVDPVCGSGTIPIEAALIGQNIAPGFNRNFICEKWDWVPDTVSEKLRDEADAQANYDAKLDITGYDIDQNMINISKRNALEAGLGDLISFKQMAVKDFKTDKLNGVIVANPPYGQRLSDQESVRKLYREMGVVYKPLKTWSKYILTSDLEFERFYGGQATKKRKLYNGALRTDYFQYWGKPVWHHEGKRETN
ncbi:MULTISPECIES: class I SAM-dependent RNA methyltransferase [Pediococcus]|uniref:THUMP domain-containing class I SAM-dependent RNA methyltransferase n=1 Tax=Pediococcus TaxID=1253 RepID=UPI000E8BE081|nr:MULTISPECIES: class I SAM-dependent RNA methyltransferase [Pediococcus]MCT3028473.1 class I SAM-dependent RNA methyltransferase [Pediococcus parvulus]MCT3034108.1 class I SAM-dependent RNA methyltransferase [Pediococcus parvulus]HBO46527.1 RNA methyltransferase [Pediococcus sp.]